MDYYSILGVNRNASAEDIRKAYKKKSMQHHPDRGGNEEEFKKVNEAYSTLKDPQKKAEYDNPQPQYRFDTSGMGGGFDDIFAQMFGRGFGPGPGFARQQRPRNSDVNIKVSLDFEEQLTGKNIIAAYRLRNGQEERVDLEIPSGVKSGDKIRYEGLGDNSLPGPRGDMFVIVNIKSKAGWRRRDDDLITNKKVNCLDLITGCNIEIETLDKRTLDLTIPKGTKNNTTFNVSGYGVPNIRTGIKGNLLITIEAEIPNLSESQIEDIKKLKIG